ncbi:MAG: hypothetical protein KatS3mg119_0266 [Rhodothalassiaceae bacterium]|nr:MAG: hypothetical protein KatS3mg119_0266 [Rhodothalassiaceae bacterium]
MPEAATTLLVAGALAAAGVAAGLALVFWSRLARVRARLEAAEAERAGFEAERRELKEALAAREERLGELRAALEAERARIAEREKALAGERETLTRLRGELEQKFKLLADEAFKANQDAFLKLANEVFGKHKTEAGAHLDRHKQALEALIRPMREHLEALQKARQMEFGALRQELKAVVEAQEKVRAETRRLAFALRAQPKVRGRWGEQQLRNVLELAGMQQHIDYVEQTARAADAGGGRLIPDVIVRLPGGGSVVIDAKTALTHYLEALETEDEDAREELMRQHARAVRQHMEQLGSKAYWKAIEDQSPDFVAMFIPGDNFFIAAIERDPALLDDAIARRVLITTPTTLLGLLKAVAWGWRQQQIEENARRITELGRELHERILVMAEHAGRLGGALENSVRHYNRLVGSLESRVLVTARRLEEWGVADAHKPLPEVGPLEIEPRALTTDTPSRRPALASPPAGEKRKG